MARSATRPKSATTLLAESLEAQREINIALSHLDLRKLPVTLRIPIKDARKAGAEAEAFLQQALQADAQALAS